MLLPPRYCSWLPVYCLIPNRSPLSEPIMLCPAVEFCVMVECPVAVRCLSKL